MSARRLLVIASATIATILAVVALLFIPLSIAVGHPLNAVVELALLVVCVWWVARVMRADRRRRLAAEAALPPERRPARPQPRRPITFQLRETLVTFAIWAALIFAFDAVTLGMDPYVNAGVAAFAGFMLATLTVTGRHMMFRLTAEEDDYRGAAAPREPPGGPLMDVGVEVEPKFGFSYADVLGIAREAEGAGFRALWVSDHLLLGADAVATDCLEAWTLLAALAVDTKTIRIGPMVTSQSYRNPALLAKIAAGVDQISGGRLEFGVGAGWKEVEYKAYGYEYPDDPTRVTQLLETLEICTRLWTEPKATYRGNHYRVEDAVCSPKPLQKPLPIWIGGTKPRVMRIAAKYAQWFNMSNPGQPAEPRIAELNKALPEACKAVGRDPATLKRSLFIQALVAPTRREVDEIVGELGARTKTTGAEWLKARPALIVGTPDQVGERLRAIAAGGIDHANVMFPYKFEVAGVRAMREIAGAL